MIVIKLDQAGALGCSVLSERSSTDYRICASCSKKDVACEECQPLQTLARHAFTKHLMM